MATISGTTGNDVLTGTNEGDTIFGLAGDDTIDGVLGADALYGGSGNDLFNFSAVQVSSPAPTATGLIDGGEGSDTIDWSHISPITFGSIRNAAGNIVAGAYVGSQQFEIRDVERILFGDRSDYISLNSTTTGLEIHAGGGSDDIYTAAGNSIYGEAGDDRFFISGTFDNPVTGLIDGGSGIDTLRMNIGFSVDLAAGTATSFSANYQVSDFEILEFNTNGYSSTGLGDGSTNIMRVSSLLDDGKAGVTFDGRAGDDYISGSSGNDVLRGGSGLDTLSYEYAAAAVRIDLATGLATGGAGRDTLASFETVIGSAYADTIIGAAGNNVLAGGAGDDTIVTVTGITGIKPDAGFDRINGGSGFDTLVLGGVQSDYHVLNEGGSTFLVTARGATEVTGVEQGAFSITAVQSWSNVLTSTSKFDGLSYIAGYSDLRAVYGTDAAAGQQHFLQYGFTEGRSLSFNALDYIASWGDLRSAFGADATAGARHFIEYGTAENRDVTFDGWAYLASYNDLIRAYGANETAAAEHFIKYGADENRATSFDAVGYAAANPDLAAAFGSDREALARHYVTYGFAEGRALGTSTSVSIAIATGATPTDMVPHDSGLPAAFVADSMGHGDAALVLNQGLERHHCLHPH
ncbi:calcium-binding protein [Sphingomonas faeni]|uniref:calcium-binding protein n=1 Tax=Sphingomonas faeni TaxID=185950 RepID=UPI0027844CB7|nr:calcium-binding protein [Sphingomonas faeni]MDQ0839396.1 Ca2+-binding RTX toxin-like protein [Sphingomonas faeni]